jgi:hypothetical protein
MEVQVEEHFSAPSCESSHAAHAYYDHSVSDSKLVLPQANTGYVPPPVQPLAEMTAASNLIPQTLLAPSPQAAPLDLPVQYDDALYYNNYSDPTLKVTGDSDIRVDYHSSDQIFDQFNATFGSFGDVY